MQKNDSSLAATDPMVLVFSRNAFYRRMHFLALAAFALSIVIVGCLITIIVYLVHNPVSPIYFATDNVGRLINVVPVREPNMTQQEVVTWTIEAIQTAYSYDFVNYRGQLQNAQKYFTRYGWTQYMRALTSSNNLLALTQSKIVAEAEVVGQPTLLTQGILGGAYAWRFRVPVLVNYYLPPYDANSKFSNALDVSVIVQRQPELEGYKGLGVVQLIGAIATLPTPQTPISNTPTSATPTTE